MQTGSTLVRVAPNPAGGWDVREPGTTRVLAHAAHQDGAVRRAHAVMLNGGIVQVLNGEGFLVETRTVPSPLERPRWYIASRPLFWALGGLFLVQGVVGVVSRGPAELRFWLAVVQLLLGASYLVLMIVSRRHDRQLLHPEQPPVSRGGAVGPGPGWPAPPAPLTPRRRRRALPGWPRGPTAAGAVP